MFIFAIVTAWLVSCLLYGTLFLIVKCNSGDLHLKMFIFFIHLWNFGEMSIFLLASSGSYNVKNDNIHRFFCCFGCKFWICRLRFKTKNTQIGPFPWKLSVLQNPDQERIYQIIGIYLRLGLKYNKFCYLLAWVKVSVNKEDM